MSKLQISLCTADNQLTGSLGQIHKWKTHEIEDKENNQQL